MASEKQVRYILHLARQAGIRSHGWMNSSWKPYTTMRERAGKVEDFVRGLESGRASELIDALKRRAKSASGNGS